MVVVDTSVWVNHLRHGEPNLERLLNDGEVMCHPCVIGELACGSIRNRTEILSLLDSTILVFAKFSLEVIALLRHLT